MRLLFCIKTAPTHVLESSHQPHNRIHRELHWDFFDFSIVFGHVCIFLKNHDLIETIFAPMFQTKFVVTFEANSLRRSLVTFVEGNFLRGVSALLDATEEDELAVRLSSSFFDSVLRVTRDWDALVWVEQVESDPLINLDHGCLLGLQQVALFYPFLESCRAFSIVSFFFNILGLAHYFIEGADPE